VWTLSNLCRHKKPPPNFETVKQAIPYLAQLLKRSDGEVLADTCWAFSYLTDGTNDKIQTVIDHQIIPRLVQLLASHSTSVITPALRVIGNIVTGNDEQVCCPQFFLLVLLSTCVLRIHGVVYSQTDAVLKADALPRLKKLLHSDKSNLVKEAAWTISNVVAGTPEQIQKVIDADLLPDIINVLLKVRTSTV
jgi:importin subunit alpha-2